MTAEVEELRREVALGSRVLAHRELAHDIVGHVSARLTPGDDQMWLRCRGPEERGLLRTSPDSVRQVGIDGIGDPGDGYELPLELPIHGAIYQARPEVRVVVHAHPRFAVLCSVANVPLRHYFGAYDLDGMLLLHDGIPTFGRSRLISNFDLGRELADAMGDKNACLLRGHGIVTAGRNVGEAMLRALRLERACAFVWQLKIAGVIDSVPEISDDDLGYFTGPNRQDISKSTEWRWRSYQADVEDAERPRTNQ